MNLLCRALLFTMIIHSSTFAGPVKIAQPFPRNVFELEGNTASVTCIAEGRPDKVQFVRRNLAGIFEKLTNTSRVYTITKTGGGRTTFTLYFETLMVSDDSAERRYECWAHQPEDQDNYWRSSAKHGFSINVISKSSTPSLLPMHSTVYKKNLGDSLSLECTITLSRQIFDIKAISAHWTRNHKIIKTVYAENGIFNRTLKPLLFNQISSENGGNYTCLLQTKMRETKPLNFSGGTSVVLVKVLMIRREEDVHVIEGQNATLQCRAEGYPVRVTWSQMNGKLEVPFAQTAKLSTISRYYKDCETCNHKVELARVTKELRGRYICRATNSLGSGTQVFNLFVDDKVKIIAPFPRNVYIVEGDTATVTCIAGGRTDMVQFVRRNELDKFEKLLNTTRVYTTSRVEGARTIFTLHFQKSILEDDSATKRYECWAHQPGDVTKHWHKSAKHGVSINVIPKKLVPRLSPEKGIIYRKRLGDSLILECNMTVSDQRFDVRAEAVHWMKNNKILKTVYAKGGQFETTLQPLYFSNISSEDGGNYSCVMETKLRGIKPLTITSGTQAVYVEIKMRRRKQILHVLKGNNVSLECSAVGYPLKVKWKKVIGGLEIDVEKIPEIARKARFRQECEYCQSKLYLYNVTAVFGGKYLCRANNSLSGGTQYFTLELTDAFTSSSFKARSTTSVFLLLLFLLENI